MWSRNWLVWVVTTRTAKWHRRHQRQHASESPDDAPASLKEMALELGFTFPFCYDESQAVARAYSAACTPDFFSSINQGCWCIAANLMTAGWEMKGR